MKNLLDVAESAALDAGKLIQHAAQDLAALNIEQKSLYDFVSEVDRNSELKISKAIHGAFPNHHIVGEEYGERVGSEDVKWIVDPLDGTTNFLRGIPHYAVSIGVMVGGRLEHSVVYDPAKNELFSASLGHGAKLNGQALQCSSLSSIEGGLYATGVPFSGDNLAKIECFTDTMVGILHSKTSGIRRLGSAALDLAYVAAGRYDGYWEANLKVWDIAGGSLLVTEAGGCVSDLQGSQQHLQTGHIVASCSGANHQLLEITSRCYPF